MGLTICRSLRQVAIRINILNFPKVDVVSPPTVCHVLNGCITEIAETVQVA